MWYICDPEKNHACQKIHCHTNPYARKVYGDNACTRTHVLSYSKTDGDGKPMIAPSIPGYAEKKEHSGKDHM